MDNLQDQLVANLPPGLLNHVTSHSATYWSLYQRFMAFQSAFRVHFLAPLQNNIISPLFAQLSSNPDLATVAILIIVLLISLKIMNMLYRTILWWISLLTRLVFWTAVLGIGLWIWQRGFSGAANDASAVGQEWQKNYQYWQQQELHARQANGMGGGGGRGGWRMGR